MKSDKHAAIRACLDAETPEPLVTGDNPPEGTVSGWSFNSSRSVGNIEQTWWKCRGVYSKPPESTTSGARLNRSHTLYASPEDAAAACRQAILDDCEKRLQRLDQLLEEIQSARDQN